MEETFSLAVPNLQINGHNYEEYLESTSLPRSVTLWSRTNSQPFEL